MDNLPIEIKHLVFSFLSVEDIFIFRYTNKDFKHYADKNILKLSRLTMQKNIPILESLVNNIDGTYAITGDCLIYLFQNNLDGMKGSNVIIRMEKNWDLYTILIHLQMLTDHTIFYHDNSRFSIVYNHIKIWFYKFKDDLPPEIDTPKNYIVERNSFVCHLKMDQYLKLYSIISSSTENLLTQIKSNKKAGINSLIV